MDEKLSDNGGGAPSYLSVYVSTPYGLSDLTKTRLRVSTPLFKPSLPFNNPFNNNLSGTKPSPYHLPSNHVSPLRLRPSHPLHDIETHTCTSCSTHLSTSHCSASPSRGRTLRYDRLSRRHRRRPRLLRPHRLRLLHYGCV